MCLDWSMIHTLNISSVKYCRDDNCLSPQPWHYGKHYCRGSGIWKFFDTQEFLIKYKVFINYISWCKSEKTIRVYGSHIIPPGAPFINMDYLNPGIDK